ncbi:MAG: hypothetical protein ACK5P5_02570 [Pseudobdellovibrionaceae bacterium]|jgi:stalled ribosome rescue protein Dom34
MSALSIWIDHKVAKIIHFTPEERKVSKIEASGQHHPKESLGKNHKIQESDEEKFYRKVSIALEKIDAQEYLILGPGVARQHFETHLKKHHPSLVPRIIANEKLDRVSENDLIDFSMKFFRHAHLFQAL